MSLFKNGFGYAIVNLLNTLSPLLLIPFIAHFYGVEVLGSYFAISLLLGVCFLLVDYSFNLISNRYLNSSDVIVFSKMQSARLILCFLSTICLTAALIIYGVSFLELISVLCMLFFYSLFPTWYFVVSGKMNTLIISTLIVRLFPIISLGITSCFISSSTLSTSYFESNQLVICVIFLSQSLGYLLSILLFSNRFKLTISGGWAVLNDGWELFISDFLPNLYNNFPVIILSYVAPPQNFASFNVGNRIVSGIMSFYYSFSRGVVPLVKKSVDSETFIQRLRVLFTLTSVMISLITFLNSEFIVELFLGGVYSDAVFVLKCLSLSLPFTVINLLFFSFFIVPNSLDAHYKKFIIKFSIFFSFLSVYAVFQYEINGMAIILLLSRVSLGVYSLCCEYMFFRRVT